MQSGRYNQASDPVVDRVSHSLPTLGRNRLGMAMTTARSMATFQSLSLSCALLLSGLCYQANAAATGYPIVTILDGGKPDRGSVNIGGKSVNGWAIAPGKSAVLKPDGDLKVPADGSIYLELTYLDRGYGRLEMTMDGTDGKKVKPAKHTRLMLMDSGAWMTTLIQFTDLVPGSSPEIRISLGRAPQDTLILSKGQIQTEVFQNPVFQYLVREDWKRPYTGTTMKGGVSNTTLRGKAMVGYQGWFRTPNDPFDSGWFHWGNIAKGQFSIDMWPDTSAYPAEALEKAADVKTLSGKTAYLFSSASPHVVRQHFAWMRKYDIDGAFLQRFIGSGGHAVNGQAEWVLGNVRDAANREGRIWAIEYDVSGAPDDKLLDYIQRDWKWMIDEFGLKKDPSYAREGDRKSVV